MERIDVIAIVPPSRHAARVVLAACRAHATGCFTLTGASDLPSLISHLEGVAQRTEQSAGLFLSLVSPEILNGIPAGILASLKLVLSATEIHRIGEWANYFNERELDFSVQVTNCEDGLVAVSLGARSIVLKGTESGGLAGSETAFVLTQRWQRTAATNQLDIPYLVQGGIGLQTAGAAVACGATGVVLDSQLLLARESEIEENTRLWIKSADGSEVDTLGQELGASFNLFHRRNSPAYSELETLVSSLKNSDDDEDGRRDKWIASASGLVSDDCLPLGQDICLAAALAETYVTVGGIITGIREEIGRSLELARQLQHLSPDSPLARSHGTRFPLLQGPMTRVSDTAEFAEAVSRNGALSFLALAVMRGKEVDSLLEKASAKLEGMPWGVGLLGFLPPAIRSEQIKVIFKYRPPFAIIAGGRPDQAKEFEDEGIPTYLHVPSPGLLRTFLRQGAKRFIFEGRECGGHVGPRSSFVLWQSAIDIILEEKDIEGLHIVFAGGIHDAVSASMIAVMSARLAERGAKVGLLMGTAYLFTEEAVTCGAIVPRFQKEALECGQTVLLETAPGHAIRCVKTPYYEVFESEKNKLIEKGATHEDIVRNLEGMNIGRLRVASKGVDRVGTADSATRELVSVSEEEQFSRGMYMIGQVATMRDHVGTMAELHREVCEGGVARLKVLGGMPRVEVVRENRPSDIAIIGMSCYYPDAASLEEYWENILQGHYAVREIPQSHWDWRLFYDEDPKTRDRIISKWGGFLKDIKFDPLRYGITPRSMEVIEPLQLLTLEAVYLALEDAGYNKRPFNRERTSCIVGIGGGAGPKSVAYGFRTCMRLADYFSDMPILSDEIIEKAGDVLPDWTEDSFPGFLANICSGRVSNRFDFGGTNYAIDAACASSLASLDACVRELECGDSDMAIAMGADAVQTPLSYMAFSKTHALSQKGHSKPFDAEGDGIVLSEGVGVVVLKRLADAERDGDRIYSVIKGIGSSSDGKAKGLTAPNASGQARALHRAYGKANISPDRVGLMEAHGTGTVVGDQTEATSLSTVLRESGAPVKSCALGSVKSMIGHSKCAAGIAGLIKTSLALHHKVLPPTLVDEPNPKAGFDESSLYLNTRLRPWVSGDESPRVAGVSAFGFGGTNFHTVLAEYRGGFEESGSANQTWPTELFAWTGSRESIKQEVTDLAGSLENASHEIDLAELSAAINRNANEREADGDSILTIIAGDLPDLIRKLRSTLSVLSTQATLEDPRGVFLSPIASAAKKVAFLFPGQGSQYPNMLADVAVAFPTVRASFDLAEAVVGDRLPRPLGAYLYPPSAFSEEEERDQLRELSRTEIAQPSLGACSAGMVRLLAEFGVSPDAVAGHSYGEYVGLFAAGNITEEELFEISYLRGKAIRDNLEAGSTMLAINADFSAVSPLLKGKSDVFVANLNSPGQTVLSVADNRLDDLIELFNGKGINTKQIPVACGFHSPFVEKAAIKLGSELESFQFARPSVSLYSNSTTEVYPEDSEEQKSLLQRHLTCPVNFTGMIDSMVRDGIEVFLEVGPGSVLSGLCEATLGQTDHAVISSDQKGRHGVTQLQFVLARLLSQGIAVKLDRLHEVRETSLRSLKDILTAPKETDKPNTWVVNGVRSKLANAPEPLLLGQPHPDLVKSNDVEKIIRSQSAPAKPAAAPKAQSSEQKPPAAAKAAAPSPRPTNQPPAKKTTPQPAKMDNQPLKPNFPINGEAPGHTGHGEDQVMMGFHLLMSQFLETQRAVMTAYLEGTPQPNGDSSHSTPALRPPQPQPQPRQPAAPAPSVPEANHAPNGNGDGRNGAGSHPVVSQAATRNQPVEAPPSPSRNGAGKPQETAKVEPAASEDVSIDKIRDHLMDIVSERTGYPHEMLEADLDLEADLGIDSIKRVEILGELAEFIMPNATGMDDDGGLDLEKLSSLRTLQQILDYLDEFLSAQPAVADDAKKKTESGEGVKKPEDEFSIQRGLVGLKQLPIPSVASTLIPNGVVLITDDGLGKAAACADRFADFGQDVVIVRHEEIDAHVEGTYTANLTDPDQVTSLIETVRQNLGPIAGVIHLLPFAPIGEEESGAARSELDAKSIYLITRTIEDEICGIAAEGNAFVLSATVLGGQLGFDQSRLDALARAGSGAISGYLKCLGMEWPDVLVRSIDFDASISPETLVECIEFELSDPPGPFEVGYLGPNRYTWEPKTAEFSAADREPRIELDRDSTILITGGARGITAAIAEELGSRFQSNLVLVGRSPLPEAEEDTATRDLTDQAELKKAIMAQMSAEGTKPTPAKVEALFGKILKDREVRDNIRRIRETGSNVEYHSADVRNREQMEALCSSIETRYGKIDGVIHGAGVIEDKLVRDKTPESFHRVFSTKVESSFALAEILDPETLKFLAFFASTASRYGNRGQADYAAANEVVCKVATELDRRWHPRVFAVAWGPWADIGMVADLEKHFATRGIALIRPEVGCRMFVEEILYGKKGESEVIIAGGAENMVTPSTNQAKAAAIA